MDIDRLSTQAVPTTQESQQTTDATKRKAPELTPSPASEQLHYKEKIIGIIDSLNKFLVPMDTFVKFEFHEKLNEYYVTLVDQRTNEVIREIPSKKMLDIYASMAELMGIAIDKRI
ncbi:flagellar protein FlaG [Bacillus lacus]|uniref:Flagellar protein FlaG n=1 Tax=Metabacillus lacus TaxID=1983721 RepID=A0A7X2IYL5_9BACI|nr:flagellar protein FlaG [Metabacillus lacus]MRX72195.1 flagellar protein FlaG [Metabacillus lacus]